MIGRIKLILAGTAILLFVIIVLQNTDTVETKLLFFSLTMPQAALLFGAMAIGFTLGVLMANRLTVRGRSERNPENVTE